MLKIAKLSTKQVKLKSKFKKDTDQSFLDGKLFQTFTLI